MKGVKIVHPNNWSVKDGIELEENALYVTKSSSNNIVIAGPGAGKTELLAQRACYLLETGICSEPSKILAISFKKDAATNLAERVEKRCGKELSRRFESKTYDTFAKHILDQFRLALDKEYRPSKNYNILLKDSEIAEVADDYVNHHYSEFPNWRRVVRRNSDLSNLLCDTILPISPISSDTNMQTRLKHAMWNILLRKMRNGESSLSFPMISKLAEYLLRENPYIRKALGMTYSHVFLDEFQDTTDIQYSLLKTSFLKSKATLTAVGDEKQRIMGWARALDGVFGKFSDDFLADTKSLVLNHRSAPKLVSIQNIISKSLEENAVEVTAPNKWRELDGTCEIWAFESAEDEATCLAEEAIKWINNDGIEPRDICIIVKQQEDIYGAVFKSRLAEQGVQAREEKEYQDLLSEDIVQIILNMITLATDDKAPESRKFVIDFLFYINGFHEETNYQVLYEFEDQLGAFIKQLNEKLMVNIAQMKKSSIKEIVYMIINFIEISKIKTNFPQYSRGNYLNEIILNLVYKLEKTVKVRGNWKECLEDICGKFSIPMMTIHKSKGLEYDTVIFVGLEDAAFWNFSNNSEEDKRSFFVALSRAKKRVIFTASKVRKTLNRDRNLTEQEQSVRNISTLYRILKQAGVPIIRPMAQSNNIIQNADGINYSAK